MFNVIREAIDDLTCDINKACEDSPLTIATFNELNARINELLPRSVYISRYDKADKAIIEELTPLVDMLVNNVSLVGETATQYGWYEFRSGRIGHIWESELQVKMCFGMDLLAQRGIGKLVRLKIEII